MRDASRSKERSCTVSTAGHGNAGGSECTKWASAGPQPAQQQRHAHGHAQLLDSRRQLDRLDAVGNELRMPRHGGEAEVGRNDWQLPQQVEHVGLLTGAVAAKHIGVEQNHTSSS